MQVNFYDLKPQIAEVVHGQEPSIRELLIYFYKSHGILESKAEKFVEKYIAEMERLRRQPFEMFISGPNAYANAVIPADLHPESKCIAEELIIQGLSMLTNDDSEDYTVTILRN